METEYRTDEAMQEIDLLEIVRLLWSRLWLIALGLILGAAATYTVSRFLITPQYKAEAIIYIFSKTTSISDLTNLQVSSQLTEDFTIIAKTREVMENVIETLGLDTTYEFLKKNTTVSNPSSSHMLQIVVKWTNAEDAAAICNTLSDELREQISDIMNTDRPSVVQRAVVPEKQSSPDLTRNAEIGALAGAVLVAAFLLARYLMDDTIKSDEDVKKYLGLNTLGMFPYIRGVDNDRAKDGKNSGKKKWPFFGKHSLRGAGS